MPLSPLFTIFQPHWPFCSLNLMLFLALKPLHWLFPLPEMFFHLLNTRMGLCLSYFTLVTYSETPPLISHPTKPLGHIISPYFNFLHSSYHSLSDVIVYLLSFCLLPSLGRLQAP